MHDPLLLHARLSSTGEWGHLHSSQDSRLLGNRDTSTLVRSGEDGRLSRDISIYLGNGKCIARGDGGAVNSIHSGFYV